jgi:hypothetical protein
MIVDLNKLIDLGKAAEEPDRERHQASKSVGGDAEWIQQRSSSVDAGLLGWMSSSSNSSALNRSGEGGRGCWGTRRMVASGIHADGSRAGNLTEDRAASSTSSCRRPTEKEQHVSGEARRGWPDLKRVGQEAWGGDIGSWWRRRPGTTMGTAAGVGKT